MATIILVRHGQTEWNRVERFRGRVDVELNDAGRRQAEAVAKRLRDEFQVAAVYSSPLSRAMDTAGPAARAFSLPVLGNGALIDIDYGEWHGITPEEAAERYPEAYSAWLESPQNAVVPGGESLTHVRDRAFDAILKLAGRHRDDTILVVSHKVVCKVLVCAVLGLDNSHFWRIDQDNAAINVFGLRNGSFSIHRINDTCHVRDLAPDQA